MFHFLFVHLFILAVLGLHCGMGLLIVVASLVAEPRL